MSKIRVLIIYSRDIERNDSGGSRTTIQLIDYLAQHEDFKCYCYFKMINEYNDNVIEITNKKLNNKNLNKFILNEQIDIIYVPEAVKYAKLANLATQNTNCKVVSALHNMPGYEKIRLFTHLKEAFFYHKSKFKRYRALVLMIFYPLFYLIYTMYSKYKFRSAYINSDKLVLLSSSFFSEFKKEYHVKNTDKLVSIGNALSFNEFATDSVILNKKKQVLIVSRLDERQKRISLAIKAWKEIEDDYSDWKLKIVGSGRSSLNYKKMVKKLELKRVEFLGYKKPKKYYKESAIFLMTSAYEGWGMTITEAQQYGCVPIVMNSFTAVNDIINSNINGIISEDANVGKFAKEIKTLIKNDELRIKLSKKAVESSKRFKMEKIGPKWVKLFEKVVKD